MGELRFDFRHGAGAPAPANKHPSIAVADSAGTPVCARDSVADSRSAARRVRHQPHLGPKLAKRQRLAGHDSDIAAAGIADPARVRPGTLLASGNQPEAVFSSAAASPASGPAGRRVAQAAFAYWAATPTHLASRLILAGSRIASRP